MDVYAKKKILLNDSKQTLKLPDFLKYDEHSY